MELAKQFRAIPEVSLGFPGVLGVRVVLPFDQILDLSLFPFRIQDFLDFVFFFLSLDFDCVLDWRVFRCWF